MERFVLRWGGCLKIVWNCQNHCGKSITARLKSHYILYTTGKNS